MYCTKTLFNTKSTVLKLYFMQNAIYENIIFHTMYSTKALLNAKCTLEKLFIYFHQQIQNKQKV